MGLTVVNILVFVGILSVLVIVHELGHFVAAKACGMRVERFKIFFGPNIFSFQRGETEYALGCIPAGGYVRITGMLADEEVPAEAAQRTYANSKTWKKLVTIGAGPAVNLVLAYAVFVVFFAIGAPTAQPTSRVDKVTKGFPAELVGVRPGDTFRSVNGVRVTGTDVAPLREALQRNADKVVRVEIERAGTTVVVTPRLRAERVQGRNVGRIGVQFAIVAGPRASSGVTGSFRDGWAFTRFVLTEQAKGIGRVFTSAQARQDVSTVIGVGAIYNDVAADGWMTTLRFVGVLSLVLGLFNLLPLFPLDGGHMLFAVIERVRGVRLSRLAYERSGMFGFLLIGLLTIYALKNDIGKITGEGFKIPR